MEKLALLWQTTGLFHIAPGQVLMILVCLALIYLIRVWLLEGFYIVTYALGIFCLGQLVGFLSPMVDPEIQELADASLPTRATDEFRPFVRRLPEFKFWYIFP